MPFWSKLFLPARSFALKPHEGHASAAEREQRPRVPVKPEFGLYIEPFPPYRATLRCPGGVTKLLSNTEAYKMLAEEACRRMQKGQTIRLS